MNLFTLTARVMKRPALLLAFIFSAIAVSAQDLVVAKDGSGNYATVQAAIDAAPTGRTTPFVIYIKNGTYKEKVTVPSNKPFIQLVGQSVANVILTYDDYASRMLTCNTTVGTQNSASFTVNATDFSAINISFINSFGDGSQGVAVLVNADRAAFKNCRFLGNQDTLYAKGSGTPRHYFKHCYIDGNVDFIFGSSVALFDSCVIYAKSRTATSTSYITAANTPTGQTYGYVFRDCYLPANTGLTSYYLGRPWQNTGGSTAVNNKTVFLNSNLSSSVHAAGWSVWDGTTNTSLTYYGEYKSKYFNGSLVDVSARVPWSFQLSDPEAAGYTNANLFGSWDPCAVVSCAPVATEIVVSNFRGVKGAGSSQFDWNISWPMSGIDYTLYRSTDNLSYSPVYTTTATNDSSVNFSYTDGSVPASGSKYYYYLAASKAGFATHITDTVIISNAPMLNVNASAALSLCGFSQALGTPSAPQTYTISGANLTADVLITPPANYEVSVNQSNWFTNTTPLSITPTAGSIANTTIYVRLNAAGAGFYSGDVLNASAGAGSVNVPVSGNTVAAPTSFLLKAWGLTQNASDSAEVRSAGVTASAATLVNLFTSDGTTPTGAVRPAYSGTYGQAFGSSTSGNSWTAVGGTLKRTYYQQFTVTASAGYSLRIDSLVLFSNFYQTSSNTKMAVVFSKTGFATADSLEITNGIGPTGAGLTFTASGNFNKSFPLTQNDAGPVSRFGLALNDVTGVTVNAGETLTIRLYWACGSSGTPRFAYLKNVQLKGVANNVLPLNLLSFSGQKNSGGAQLHWQTSNETGIDHFEVEKSKDNRSYLSIVSVRAKNGAVINSYSFVDASFNGTAFYRLKIVDDNGSQKQSNIVRLEARTNASLVVYPNPAGKLISVLHATAGSAAMLELFSTTGKKMRTWPVVKGQQQTNLNIAELPAGVYLVRYSDGDSSASQFIFKN